MRRKEDRRFLTGRGHYVDDIVRPQQLYAVFLRSPHAHAEIWRSTPSPALASARRARGLYRRPTSPARSAACLRLGINGKDGTPMKEPPHPPLATAKVRHVGDPVAMVIAETLGRRPRTPPN